MINSSLFRYDLGIRECFLFSPNRAFFGPEGTYSLFVFSGVLSSKRFGVRGPTCAVASNHCYFVALVVLFGGHLRCDVIEGVVRHAVAAYRVGAIG